LEHREPAVPLPPPVEERHQSSDERHLTKRSNLHTSMCCCQLNLQSPATHTFPSQRRMRHSQFAKTNDVKESVGAFEDMSDAERLGIERIMGTEIQLNTDNRPGASRVPFRRPITRCEPTAPNTIADRTTSSCWQWRKCKRGLGLRSKLGIFCGRLQCR